MTQEEREQLASYLNYVQAQKDKEPTPAGKEAWDKLAEQAKKEMEK